jgi:ABC-2 type transport system ATP-binding protein
LDEPTIGLDAISKDEIRNFLTKVNREENVTIILTTHDMDDIEALCSRIILIDDGTIAYDGSLDEFKQKYIRHKTVEYVLLSEKNKKKYQELLKLADDVEQEGRTVRLRINIKKCRMPDILSMLLDSADVEDLTMHTPRLEHVIKEVYEKNKK